MGDEATAPETSAPDTQTDTSAAPETGTTAPDRLPDDHPVVVALKKANDEAAATRKRLKEIEDAEKTELQRATDDHQAEKTRADGLEAELKRLQVAIKHGISDQDIGLLGTDPKEFEANAKRVAELAGSQKKKQGNRVSREGANSTAAASEEAAFVRGLFNPGG